MPPPHHICITGSLAAKQSDRVIDACALSSVTVVTPEGAKRPLRVFPRATGISSLAILGSTCLAIATTSSIEVVHGSKRGVAFDDGLSDVHELTVSPSGSLGIASTGSEEIVLAAVNDDGEGPTIEVRERLNLREIRPNSALDHLSSTAKRSRFHANQLFVDRTGERWALVHHIDGWQPVVQVASKILKRHGNGGLVNLRTGTALALGLSAPHSVRDVGDETWICDSATFRIRRYGPDWTEIEPPIPTLGWGRGVAVDEPSGFVHVGLSPIRARYRSHYANDLSANPMVQTFDLDGTEIERMDVEGIDQINGVHLLPPAHVSMIEDLAEHID